MRHLTSRCFFYLDHSRLGCSVHVRSFPDLLDRAISVPLPHTEIAAMAFIKLEDVVINTSYIAAIRFECKTRFGEPCVSLLIAIPPAALSPQESPTQGLYHYEWLRFTGDPAKALQDYFSSFNNVIDLLPQYDPPACCNSSWSGGALD